MPRLLLPFLVALGSCSVAAEPANSPSAPHAVRVIDGDTFVIDGETIRLSNIDAPETGARAGCWAEARLATEATYALELAAASWAIMPPLVTREGQDRYGRTLARVSLQDGSDIGQAMIDKGLAVEWTGRRWDWCGPVTDTAAGASLLRAPSSPMASWGEHQ